MIEDTYKCPIDLIAHGLPHRILADHDCHSHNHHHQTTPQLNKISK